MNDAVLHLDDLSKRFGGLKVTDKVTLDVQPGEVHAIIGPNGAGKTTLVHQISGLLAPNAGRILFQGIDVTNLRADARAQLGIARTFQITSVMPSFTVLDNVALAAQAKAGSSFRFFRVAAGEAELTHAAFEALDRVSLLGRAREPAERLSHGEKRSLELAMALAQRPQLLLLDEPMAGTGRQETERLIEMLGGLKGGFAMLLVEHDMRAVFALADRVSVLVNGRIIASGRPDDVRADPEVRAAYLGEAV